MKGATWLNASCGMKYLVSWFGVSWLGPLLCSFHLYSTGLSIANACQLRLQGIQRIPQIGWAWTQASRAWGSPSLLKFNSTLGWTHVPMLFLVSPKRVSSSYRHLSSFPLLQSLGLRKFTERHITKLQWGSLWFHRWPLGSKREDFFRVNMGRKWD